MATERTSSPHHEQQNDAHAPRDASETPLLPGRSVTTPPPPGTEEAAFLDNLNEAYGVPDAMDDQVLEGIRRQMRTVLDTAHDPSW